MKALVRRGGQVSLEIVEEPQRGEREVLIEVALAAMCRTDIYVAEGILPVKEPLVLGHELSGAVVEASPASGLVKGDRVTVIPSIACGRCAGCAADSDCLTPQFLGVDRDGAFAERVVVPEAYVRKLPDSMDLKKAAYVEPVTAALAVLNAPLEREGRGLVLGENRIATLITRVLRLHGCERTEQLSVEAAEAAGELFDYVIESEATAESLLVMLEVLQPGGRAVLKSRPSAAVPIDELASARRGIRFV